MARNEAFFLPMERGDRFCLLHSPADTVVDRGAVLFIHPFAEEMNKSRRMAALQARTFADAGWTVLQIDLFGCGDSAGDFGEADWQRWVDDVLEAAEWMRARTGRLPVLWGLRAGCLLAAQAARSMEPAPDLVLWQPVTSGKQCLQQFLRLKVANQILVQMDGKRAGTQQLREQLARGETIEVAGYALSPALALGMEAAELDLPGSQGRAAWFEVCGSAGCELSPAARMRIQAWRDIGYRIEAKVVEGPAFWQTQEIGECPALIESTLAAIEGWRA